MTYTKAVKKMFKGFKVKRPSFNNEYWFFDKRLQQICLHRENGQIQTDCFDISTLMHCEKNDWQIVKEKKNGRKQICN